MSNKDAPRYQGRKGCPTPDVLVACSLNLKFTYVLPYWDGTSSDLRIINSVLTRNNDLKIPWGKFNSNTY